MAPGQAVPLSRTPRRRAGCPARFPPGIPEATPGPPTPCPHPRGGLRTCRQYREEKSGRDEHCDAFSEAIASGQLSGGAAKQEGSRRGGKILAPQPPGAGHKPDGAREFAPTAFAARMTSLSAGPSISSQYREERRTTQGRSRRLPAAPGDRNSPQCHRYGRAATGNDALERKGGSPVRTAAPQRSRRSVQARTAGAFRTLCGTGTPRILPAIVPRAAVGRQPPT